MNVNEADFLSHYQQFTDKTAQYPQGMVYVTLGLVGELGELKQKLEELDSDASLSEEEKSGIAGEAGDVFWYVARACQELELPLGMILGHAFMGPGAPKKGECGSEVHYRGFNSSDGWVDVCALAENTKKLVRDGKPIDHTVALNALISSVRMTAALCFRSGIDPMQAMSKNMDKLSSRLERGVIKGDGDRR